MNNLLKTVLIIIILLIVFFTNFSGHYNQMPMHVDSWQVISKASYIIKQQSIMPDEPFSHLKSNYPEGAAAFLAVLATINAMDILAVANFLPALLNIILALLLYMFSKALFKNEMASLAIMAFTPLIISNITMLGIFYLVPVAFGMVLSYLFFGFLVRKEWIPAFLVFLSILVTHNSSLAFASIAFFLYFIFNRGYRGKIKYLFFVLGIGLFGFILTRGFEYTLKLIPQLFVFEKSPPYFSIYLTLSISFIVFTAIGTYLVLTHEKEARKFLIPLFAFLAIDALAYWYFQGMFLVYRRLYVFLFSLLPFFVGYAVWFISSKIESSSENLNLKGFCPVMLILLILLIPQAVELNIKEHQSSYQYVTKTEHELFRQFGEKCPDNYLVADHLESFAFPYYNIRPVVLSPMHGVNTTYYRETLSCFVNQDIECFEEFFNRTGFRYLYTSTYVNSTYFEPFLIYDDKIIYKYVK